MSWHVTEESRLSGTSEYFPVHVPSHVSSRRTHRESILPLNFHFVSPPGRSANGALQNDPIVLYCIWQQRSALLITCDMRTNWFSARPPSRLAH